VYQQTINGRAELKVGWKSIDWRKGSSDVARWWVGKLILGWKSIVCGRVLETWFPKMENCGFCLDFIGISLRTLSRLHL